MNMLFSKFNYLYFVFLIFFSGCANNINNSSEAKIFSNTEISEMETRLKQDKNNTELRRQLIIGYIGNKDYELAKNALAKTLTENDNDINANYLMGLICSRQGSIEEAVKYYNNALKVNPKHIESLFNLAAIEQNKGRHEQSRKLYNKLLEIDPNDADTHYNLALLYDKKFYDTPKAIYHYEKCVKLYIKKIIKRDFIHNIKIRLNELKSINKKG